MDISTLIKKLKELKEKFDHAKNIKGKIDELIAELEKVKNEKKPKMLAGAKILIDLLDLLADQQPEVVSDFVKAYLEAFKNAVDLLTRILWEIYKRLRATGWTDEDIRDAGVVSIDPDILEWFRIRYELDKKSTVSGTPPKPETSPDPPATGGTVTLPSGHTVTVPWDATYDACCRVNGVAGAAPAVEWGTPAFKTDGGNIYVSIEVGVSHPCGIASSGMKVEIQTPTVDVTMQPKPWQWPKHDEKPGSKGRTYKIKKLQVGKQPGSAITVQIRAASNCGGGIDQMRKFTAP